MNPVSLDIDFNEERARIEYRVGSFVSIETIAPHVMVERDVEYRVLAIEMRAVDLKAAIAASDFAAANGLTFPDFMHTYKRASEAINPQEQT